MSIENNIASKLLNQPDFLQTTVQNWESLTVQYPYFSLAQLLLAKKMLSNKDADLEKQVQKTALHFSNTPQLDFLLFNGFFNNEIISIPVAEIKVQPKAISIETEELQSERLSSMLGQQLAAFKKPVSKNEKLPIEAEPLFKVDYFASQGIIFTKQQQDALGAKVKKFTDWLKDIKKTTSGEPQLNTTEEEEKRAAAQAMASLENKETVTESMAEVLLRQHKKDHAIEIYKKLSLLYPEKSTYFASKLNSLQN